MRAKQQLFVEQPLVLAPEDKGDRGGGCNPDQLRGRLAGIDEMAPEEPSAAGRADDGSAVGHRLGERRVRAAGVKDVGRVHGHRAGVVHGQSRIGRDKAQVADAAVGHRAADAADVASIERPDKDDADVG